MSRGRGIIGIGLLTKNVNTEHPTSNTERRVEERPNESATSGRAGGSTKAERLNAAWPCGQWRPCDCVRLSLPVRNERGESRREGLVKRVSLLSPALSSSFARRRGSCGE